jgi:hypothetical protein
MSATIVVGILVAVGEAHAPGTTALLAAAADALGPGASFVVEDTVTPSDSDALTAEDRLHAAAVVELAWSNAAGPTAGIRIHVAHVDRWIERRITFLPGDTQAERGRTIGFAVASMLLSETEFLSPAEPPVNTPREKTPRRRDPPESPDAAVPPGPGAPTTIDTTATEPIAPPSAQPWAIDLTAVGSVGLGGPASGIGGATHVEFSVLETIWLRAGGGVRTGGVPGQEGTDLVTWGTIGAAWRPLFPTGVGQLGTAVRLDGGTLFHYLSHRVADGQIEHKGRVVPGAVLMVEELWRFRPSLDVFFALGSEVAFGWTEVSVLGQLVTTIPPIRGMAELGVRLHL